LKIFALFFCFTTILFAKEYFGSVVRFKGDVFINEKKLTQNASVFVSDLITTKKFGKVQVAQNDGSVITIGGSSTLRIVAQKEVEQTTGNAFYDITKAITNVLPKLKVKTRTVVIGIRGTDFIVNNLDNEQVLLRSGKLQLESLKNDFKVFHGKKGFSQEFEDEFNSFDNFIKDDFNSFKKEITYEFDSFQKSISMEQGDFIFINNDGELYRQKLSKQEMELKFKYFETF